MNHGLKDGRDSTLWRTRVLWRWSLVFFFFLRRRSSTGWDSDAEPSRARLIEPRRLICASLAVGSVAEGVVRDGRWGERQRKGEKSVK